MLVDFSTPYKALVSIRGDGISALATQSHSKVVWVIKYYYAIVKFPEIQTWRAIHLLWTAGSANFMMFSIMAISLTWVINGDALTTSGNLALSFKFKLLPGTLPRWQIILTVSWLQQPTYRYAFPRSQSCVSNLSYERRGPDCHSVSVHWIFITTSILSLLDFGLSL